jgi:outer membrane biosynthesis protein TonB
MKNVRYFFLTCLLMAFSSGIVLAIGPAFQKEKSFHACPVNAKAGKRANVRTTVIRKKGKPQKIKKVKTQKTKTVKQKAVKQKTAKTKTPKQKTEKVKTPKQKTEKVKKVKQQSDRKNVSKKETSKHMPKQKSHHGGFHPFRAKPQNLSYSRMLD